LLGWKYPPFFQLGVHIHLQFHPGPEIPLPASYVSLPEWKNGWLLIKAIPFQIHDFCDGFFAILLVAELVTFQNVGACFGINGIAILLGRLLF